MTKELTLSQHAEMWYEEQGNVAPQRDTSEWDDMYAEWIEFAFPPVTVQTAKNMTLDERGKKIRRHLTGIYNLSPIAEAPHFGKAPCPCCGSKLAGDRYKFAGRVGVEMPDGKINFKERIEDECCVDCYGYLFT